MNFILNYAFPLTAALLLMAFYTGLPPLNICRLGSDDTGRAFDRTDFVIAGAITLLYALMAFTGLGNAKSPQSFIYMGNNEVVFELEADTVPKQLVLFTGVGMGEYDVCFSDDETNYAPVLKYSQTHVENLKWEYIPLDTETAPRFLRISGNGSLYLGELSLLDAGGAVIPMHSDVSKLCDEQELVPFQQDLMNSTYFDEIYHVRTAWENLNGIYPYEISHPPLGKLIIALGIRIFGMSPFGWRFMGAFFGTLMLPLMYVFCKKIFGGRAVPMACTAVFATDFMHFVQTRIATIDTYAVFFIILMYMFMYLFITSGRKRFLALSGLFFGLGAASKWTCIYAGAGLAVIWLSYWLGKFYSKEHSLSAVFRPFFRNCLFCLMFFVAVPCIVYYISYYPYGLANGMHGIGMLFSRDYLCTVLNNQSFMYSYHSGLVAEHPYSSFWYQWILDIRPILYYLKYYEGGLRSSLAAFVNPALCWGGFLALFVLIYTAVFRRDHDARFILIGFLSQLVPWMFVKRLTFEYHYFPCTVFLVLALGYIFRLMELNTKSWKTFVYSFSIVNAVLFVLFYPVLSGVIVNGTLASRLMGWLPTWPISGILIR